MIKTDSLLLYFILKSSIRLFGLAVAVCGPKIGVALNKKETSQNQTTKEAQPILQEKDRHTGENTAPEALVCLSQSLFISSLKACPLALYYKWLFKFVFSSIFCTFAQ